MPRSKHSSHDLRVKLASLNNGLSLIADGFDSFSVVCLTVDNIERTFRCDQNRLTLLNSEVVNRRSAVLFLSVST